MSTIHVTIDGQPFAVNVALLPNAQGVLTAVVDGESVVVEVPQMNTTDTPIEWAIVDGRPYELSFDEHLNWVRAFSGLHRVDVHDAAAGVARPRSTDGRIKAPIPGLVTRVLVEVGETVSAEQPLMVLEAMKMENEIRAPFDGVVSAVPVSAGQSVLRNDILVKVRGQ